MYIIHSMSSEYSSLCYLCIVLIRDLPPPRTTLLRFCYRTHDGRLRLCVIQYTYIVRNIRFCPIYIPPTRLNCRVKSRRRRAVCIEFATSSRRHLLHNGDMIYSETKRMPVLMLYFQFKQILILLHAYRYPEVEFVNIAGYISRSEVITNYTIHQLIAHTLVGLSMRWVMAL